MKNSIRTLTSLTFFIACIIPLSAWAADGTTGKHFLKYSVSNGDVTVVEAVTPYDSDPQAKEAFLNWFKRGFETVLKGKPPLMVEWGVTSVAYAGRDGYDFGMDEAERYLKKEKGSSRSLNVVPLPPLRK
jgi:hypothetical protein